jgi:DEAD/DEAH box helicase domain-containing protein
MTIAPALWDDVLATSEDELAHLVTEPERPAHTVGLPPALHPRVVQALAAQGVNALYSHQADAWLAA